jgi:hypothetical protein
MSNLTLYLFYLYKDIRSFVSAFCKDELNISLSIDHLNQIIDITIQDLVSENMITGLPSPPVAPVTLAHQK